MQLSIVILAAGLGKRMHSNLPKVLHPIGGQPLLWHVLKTARELTQNIFVIYGHEGEKVKASCSNFEANWIEQREQLGTAHAVQQAIPHIPPSHQVLILMGDCPLIRQETLTQLLNKVGENAVGIIVAEVDNPHGLGRIIQDDKEILAVVEEKDATTEQKQIRLINSGIISAPAAKLSSWLKQIKNNNAQREYYLPDIIQFARREQVPIYPVKVADAQEILGINDREQLAALERIYQQKISKRLMQSGVTLIDPTRFDCRGEVEIAPETTIDINVILEGSVSIGTHCYIGANSILKNVKIGHHVTIKPFSHIEDAVIHDHCIVGPFARIRPHTELHEHTHIGNFVEIKQTVIGKDSKVNHLSYIGDTIIGERVNVGAGTITCNYDGAVKHQTIIEDDVFIGSDTQLVAPVTLKKGSTIGAGSTITKDTPAEQLTLSRTKQVSIENWQRPKKTEK